MTPFQAALPASLMQKIPKYEHTYLQYLPLKCVRTLCKNTYGTAELKRLHTSTREYLPTYRTYLPT